METAAEIVQNFRQRLRDFIAFMEDNSGDETPRLRSALERDRDMEQVGPEIDTSGEGHRVAAPDTSDNSGGFYIGGHRRVAPDTSDDSRFYIREHRVVAPDTSNNSGGLFGGHRGAAPDIRNNLFGGHREAAPNIRNNSGGLFGGHRGAAPDASNNSGGLFGGHRGAAPDTSNNSGGLFGGHRGETSLNRPGVATANRNGFFDRFYTGEDHDNSTRHMPGRFPPSRFPVQPPMQAGVFGRLFTGEHHDDSSLNMPGSPSHVPDVLERPGSLSHPRGMLWPEMPRPSGSFTHDPIPAPPMQAGRENPIINRFDTGEYHHESLFPETSFHESMFIAPLNDAGPAPVMPGLFTGRINDARLADMRAGENFLDQLPDISLDDIPNATDCNICMEPFGSTEDPESPVQLPCGHVMGRKCISRWLETSNSCPLCRHVLFGQERGSQFEQEGSVLFGQGNFNRSWDNLEPRLQELIRSMTAQEQHHLLQVLQESAPSEIETVQRGQVGIPGGSPEEVEAYRVELREISRQRAAIDTRLAEIEGDGGLVTSQAATTLRELEEDNEALHTRLDNFHARYRYVSNFTSLNQAI